MYFSFPAKHSVKFLSLTKANTPQAHSKSQERHFKTKPAAASHETAAIELKAHRKL